MSAPMSMSGPDTDNFAGPSDAAMDNVVSFTDGSFTTAATPTPGLTAGLSNVTGAVASVASGVSSLTSSTSGLFMLLAVGGALWLWLRKKV